MRVLTFSPLFWIFLSLPNICEPVVGGWRRWGEGRTGEVDKVNRQHRVDYVHDLGRPTGSSKREYMDYHLYPEPAPAPATTSLPPIIYRDSSENVSLQLGDTLVLRCRVHGAKTNQTVVSWTKGGGHLTALTYNEMVFVSDRRISVEVGHDKDTWTLVILRVKESDQGTYFCHLNSDQTNKQPFHVKIAVPKVTMKDGFGRVERAQYYKTGSSLEIVCTILMPREWKLRIDSPEDLVIWEKDGELEKSEPKASKRILTEVENGAIVSRLSITQARQAHSGNYSCSVPHHRKTEISVFILEEEASEVLPSSGHVSHQGFPPFLVAILAIRLSNLLAAH